MRYKVVRTRTIREVLIVDSPLIKNSGEALVKAILSEGAKWDPDYGHQDNYQYTANPWGVRT